MAFVIRHGDIILFSHQALPVEVRHLPADVRMLMRMVFDAEQQLFYIRMNFNI